jgi:integrase
MQRGCPVIVEGAPLVFWEDGTFWSDANDFLYARMGRVTSRELHLRTVQAEGVALHAFAKWLEVEGCDWRESPVRREMRPLVRYKAALLHASASSRGAPGALRRSTAAARMRVVLHFYRWARSQGVIEPIDLEEFNSSVRVFDEHGFRYSKPVLSSNLLIRSSKPHGDDGRLEGGAHPVSAVVQEQLLSVARLTSPFELYLMLQVGFLTGMRLGSICSLKIQTLERAIPLEGTDLALTYCVGPEACPPVSTKFGRTGRIIIPAMLHDDLLVYSASARRAQRERKAAPEDKDILFLTRGGRRFVTTGLNRSPTVNALMTTLRQRASSQGVSAQGFTFHCTRATFATRFAELGVALNKVDEAVAFLKEVMLHKDEATTWRYIRYVHNETARGDLADRFTRETFGLVTVPPDHGYNGHGAR